ncbi:MAG TPA: T9SS type A sorting domain-containing protein [Cytophagaceae bacterium]|jgi:PKD repeat protein|nr:T9SS type A sorting domain-containing protein [Cytophagaceae bacterium]
MKNIKILFTVFGIVFCTLQAFAQAPFSLPPKWFFGHRAGMNFTGGAPAALAGNVWDAVSYNNQEGSTTECLPNGNVLYYSNSCRLANGANVNFGPTLVNGGGNSSTQGCVGIPNPANPSTQFYFITTEVDASGGSDCSPQPNPGVWVYNMSNAPVLGTVTQLTTAVGVGEFIAACSDNTDGYNIISHAIDGSGNTTFYVWNISNTGTINATPNTFAGSINGVNWKYQGGIKVNKCNTKIAFLTNNGFEVRNWAPATGTIGSVIRSGTGLGMGLSYGVEFSPDGNILYMTDYNGSLYHYDIVNGIGPTVISASNAGSGSSQGPGYGNVALGPDDKIYLSNRYSAADAPVGGKWLAVISNPNSTTATQAGVGFAQTGAGAFALAAPSTNYPSTQAGLITLGWHNPFLTITEGTAPCENFTYTYKQYYGTSIPVLAGSEEWDFGDAGGWRSIGVSNPSHAYATNGSYTVKLRVKDQLCQNFYTTQKNITVSCTLPVELIKFNAEKSGSGVLLTWATATEINNNYFEVQRSADGINFTSIGTVKGNGTSSSTIYYRFNDPFPLPDANYYRLVQQNKDGTKENSGVVAVSIEGIQISVFPNPSTDNFNIKISGANNASVIITDILGRKIYKNVISEGLMEFSFGKDLPEGSYVIEVITDNQVQIKQVIKQ